MIRLIFPILFLIPLICNASFEYSGDYKGDGQLMLEQIKLSYEVHLCNFKLHLL